MKTFSNQCNATKETVKSHVCWILQCVKHKIRSVLKIENSKKPEIGTRKNCCPQHSYKIQFQAFSIRRCLSLFQVLPRMVHNPASCAASRFSEAPHLNAQPRRYHSQRECSPEFAVHPVAVASRQPIKPTSALQPQQPPNM